MKSYWILAAGVVLLALPSSSKAYFACMDQTKAEEKPVQQAHPPNSSAAEPDTAKANLTPETAKPSTAAPGAGGPTTTAKAQGKNSYLLIELSKTLKASKLKPGDKVKGEVTQDVISHGKVIIPVETEVVGHVTEVSVRNSEKPESRLGIVFDRILLKHYHDVSFRAVVQAVSAPVQRRSRVDEPSQMLPPSMVVGNMKQPSSAPAGRGGTVSNRGAATPGPSSSMAASLPASAYQTPMTVKQSPTTHAASGASAAQLEPAQGKQALSVGMPQGVTGLKGLSLTPGATESTPGPVVISNVDNVKLESGTQILLRVMSVETPQDQGSK